MNFKNIIPRMKLRVLTAAAVIAALLTAVSGYYAATLPDKYYGGNNITLHTFIPVTVSHNRSATVPASANIAANTVVESEIKLLGILPVKQATIAEHGRELVRTGGFPFGIKMLADGAVVTSYGDTGVGGSGVNSPAQKAGIQPGDIIISIDGKRITKNDDIKRAVQTDKAVKIEYKHGNNTRTVSVTPVKTAAVSDDTDDIAADNTATPQYKIGIWVRDSTAGIGTVTFYNDKIFAGLGHGVCDSDTGQIMPLGSGEIVPVNISGVEKGGAGTPGELCGSFAGSSPAGIITANTPTGLFGEIAANGNTMFNSGSNPLPVAWKQEVEEGEAEILSTLSGSEPKRYSVVIEKINYNENNKTKNMVIRVTDPELLANAGGIVQGMSGSPIVQNGMLAGAVTHVFVSDSTRGYGIFAENMLTVAQ